METVSLKKLAIDINNKQGFTSKFWKAYVYGKMLIANWGKIGTKGQRRTWTFGSNGEAKQILKEKVAGKLGNRYKLIYSY